MIRKALTAILCILVALVAFAQTPKHAIADTMATQIIVTDSSAAPAVTVGAFTADDGSSYVIYNGKAYSVAEAIDAVENLSEDVDDLEYALNSRSDNSGYDEVWEVLVVFGFPCMTIIVALVCLLLFFHQKNSARTHIIENAIEHDYQLPDAFYTGVSSAPPVDAGVYDKPGAEGLQTEGHEKFMSLVPQRLRDPKDFNSAVTTIAISLPLLLCVWNGISIPLALLIGGIPLCIGIGRLVSYFFVPATNRNRPINPMSAQYQPRPGQYSQQQPPYGYTGQQQNQPWQQDRYAQPQNPPCPPPFPGEKHEND